MQTFVQSIPPARLRLGKRYGKAREQWKTGHLSTKQVSKRGRDYRRSELDSEGKMLTMIQEVLRLRLVVGID